MKIQSLCPENEPNYGQIPYLAMLKNPSKNSYIWNVDDFRNLMVFSTLISDKIFMKMR